MLTETLRKRLLAAAESYVALGCGAMYTFKNVIRFELQRTLPRPLDEVPHWQTLLGVPCSRVEEHKDTNSLRWYLSNKVMGPHFARALIPLVPFTQQMKLGYFIDKTTQNRKKYLHKELGEFLVLRRLELGLTQAELHRRMPVKISIHTVIDVELGRKCPSIKKAVGWAQVLELPGFPVFIEGYSKEVRRWRRNVNRILSKRRRSTGSRTSVPSTKST